MAYLDHETPQAVPHSARRDLLHYIVVRTFILALMVGHPLFCLAQTTQSAAISAAPGWHYVQDLPAGTPIHVKARTASMNCVLTAVDDSTLTCMHHTSVVFHRADIVSVAIPHRGRSALIFGGVGAGVGVAVVKLVATVGFNGFFNGKAKGAVYAGGAGLGVLAFAPIGYATDVTQSTIYRAP